MNALFYLHKRILINGFKRSIRKPAFVLMLIAAIAYLYYSSLVIKVFSIRLVLQMHQNSLC